MTSLPDYSVDQERIDLLTQAAKLMGGNALLGRRLGFKDGSFVGQMIAGKRAITEKTFRKMQSISELKSLFAPTPTHHRVQEPAASMQQHQKPFDRVHSLINSVAAFVLPFERANRLEAAELLKQLCLAPDSEIVRSDVLQALLNMQHTGNVAAAA